jgi:uncharacterized membrane protein
MPETIDATPGGNPYSPSAGQRDVSSSITVTRIIYALHALAPFTAWTLAIVAMIIGRVTRDDVAGSWLESHYSHLSRTFWWGMLWSIVAWAEFWRVSVKNSGIVTFMPLILLLGVMIWYMYRVSRGWVKLNDKMSVA